MREILSELKMVSSRISSAFSVSLAERVVNSEV